MCFPESGEGYIV